VEEGEKERQKTSLHRCFGLVLKGRETSHFAFDAWGWGKLNEEGERVQVALSVGCERQER